MLQSASSGYGHLPDGSTYSAFRVELCVDGISLPVCMSALTDEIAQAFCSVYGYPFDCKFCVFFWG